MLFIKARRLKVELHRLDRKKWHNRPWQKKQPEERQESPCLQSWCYLQVACWASLKTKNPGWPKSHKTHFQVAITFAYACPCRIILERVFFGNPGFFLPLFFLFLFWFFYFLQESESIHCSSCLCGVDCPQDAVWQALMAAEISHPTWVGPVRGCAWAWRPLDLQHLPMVLLQWSSSGANVPVTMALPHVPGKSTN